MYTDQALSINRAAWDKVAAQFHSTTLPSYGPLAQLETELHLIEPVQGARVLEIGCGSGYSLLYLAQQGASEVWGLDFSHTQIELANSLLGENGLAPRLFESPMELNPGIPLGYFDFVISIYALGWTVDLSQTLAHISSYLKPSGCFVFSWEHPAYSCLEYKAGEYVLKNSYHREGPKYHESWKGVPIILNSRKLESYVNSLINAGLVIERLIESKVDVESAQDHHLSPDYWYSLHRAKLMPTTMIIKARKYGR